MKKLLTVIYLLASVVCFSQSLPYKNADSLVSANTLSLLQYNRAGINRVYYSSVRLDTLSSYVGRSLFYDPFGCISSIHIDTIKNCITKNLTFKIANDIGGTIGGSNTTFGYQSGNFNITGISNTAIGVRSLKNVTSGSNNVAVGVDALLSDTSGTQNISIGHHSLLSNKNGYDNIGIGNDVLYSINGYQNVAIGSSSIGTALTGHDNVAVGYQTLFGNRSGSKNVAIGYQAGVFGNWNEKLFVDNKYRGDSASQLIKSLIVGTFGVDSSDQDIRINGSFEVRNAVSFPALATDSTMVLSGGIYVDALGYLKRKY